MKFMNILKKVGGYILNLVAASVKAAVGFSNAFNAAIDEISGAICPHEKIIEVNDDEQVTFGAIAAPAVSRIHITVRGILYVVVWMLVWTIFLRWSTGAVIAFLDSAFADGAWFFSIIKSMMVF